LLKARKIAMKAHFIAVLLLASAAILPAQTFRGGIQGVIVDRSGAAITFAEVTINSPETGLTRTVQSDATGNYFVSELPIGSYEVTVKKAGFRTETVKAVSVVVSINQQIDVQLDPGPVTETIEVTAHAPLVETRQNTLGG